MHIRSVFKMVSVLVVLLVLMGAGVRWLWLQRSRPVSVPILMYHRIGDDFDSPWWVTVRDFETQLQSLRDQGYASVWPSDLVAHQRWGRPLPPKPIILTFDDGYLNIMEHAEPLLKKYGYKGVSYLISGMVGDTPETRQKWEGTPLLIWPEVRAMEQRGTIRFGGHSRTHANLRAMTDPHQEIASCYRDLKRKGGFTPEGFCYPFGQYKAETLDECAHSKFTTATTCDDGIAELKPGTSLFELPRVSVVGGWHRFRLQTQPGPDGTVQVKISKEGRDLDLTPKLIWGDGTQQWFIQEHITASPLVIAGFQLDHSHVAPVLELWDNLRVIRFFRAPVPLAN